MRLALYCKTLRWLKPCQLLGQLRLKFLPNRFPADGWTNKKAYINRSVNVCIPELDINTEHIARFAIEELSEGSICLINARTRLQMHQWECADMSHLWNFNLHYFEYAAAMAGQYQLDGDKKWAVIFQRFYENWLNNPVKDAFHPYTISLRLRNLLIADSLFGDALSDEFRKRLYGTLYIQYRFLEKHPETALLGNHYFENICSVIIGSACFCENDILCKWVKLLDEQTKEQILSDGFHCERSPMYHKLILESLIRAVLALRTSGSEDWQRFLPVIRKMLGAAVSMERAANRIPLFNDSGDNIAKPLDALTAACDSLFGIKAEPKEALPAAGYYFLKENDTFVICDAGEMAPNHLMGHGHCDCLSFELFRNGNPLLVNCGTGLYQGEQRAFFRSTAAHNTFTVFGEEQAECWGEHRVAGRFSDVQAETGRNRLCVSFRSFSGRKYSRKFALTNSVFTVSDKTDAPLGTEIRSFLHIAPVFQVSAEENGSFRLVKDGIIQAVIFPVGAEVCVSDALYAPSFGDILSCKCLCFTWRENGNEHGYKVCVS